MINTIMETSSSSDDELSTTCDSYSSDDHEVSRRVKQTTNNRLPDYTGMEKWKVWINHFLHGSHKHIKHVSWPLMGIGLISLSSISISAPTI
jgi:hypothetical protein